MSERVKITGTTRGYGVNADVDLVVELSLRDLFAAFALAGLTADTPKGPYSAIPLTWRDTTRTAYAMADSMLETRQGK